MSIKNLITIIALSLLTIGSYLFLKSVTPKTVIKESSREKKAVATAYGISTRYFNADNQLQYKLVSPKAIEYSNNYGTELVKPDLIVFNIERVAIWKGKADTGLISSNKDHLLLQNNVKIIETPFGNKPTYITGKIMSYQTKKSILTSDLPVQIDDGIVKQISNKLRLDTKTKKLNATNRVHAIYNTSKNTEETNE